ncbi:MAG: sensor histidine kinase [bacterium]|nr:sensor histidine kinase [bacterium]
MMNSFNQKDANSSTQFFHEMEIEFLIHELKDPISIIESGTRAMLEKPEKYGALSARQEKTLKRSLRSVRKAREMLNGLLEIGRSEAGQFACRSFQALGAMHKVLREILDTSVAHATISEGSHELDNEEHLRQFFRQHGIFFDINAQAREVELVQDETKFQQIFGNLLKNALHHRKERVHIRLAREGDFIQIDMADDGPGVNDEHREAIFQRYTRINPQPDLPRQGHGLGLAGALILARCLGGDIELHSTRGQGATFRLILPITFDREDLS